MATNAGDFLQDLSSFTNTGSCSFFTTQAMLGSGCVLYIFPGSILTSPYLRVLLRSTVSQFPSFTLTLSCWSVICYPKSPISSSQSITFNLVFLVSSLYP